MCPAFLLFIAIAVDAIVKNMCTKDDKGESKQLGDVVLTKAILPAKVPMGCCRIFKGCCRVL